MSLSKRLVGLVFLTIIISAVLITATVSFVTLTRFNRIEDRELADNMGRLNDAINIRLEGLASKNGDWSNWDDAYGFVQGQNPAFIDSNLTDNGFVQLNINSMYFFDTDKHLVYGKFVELKHEQAVSLPTGLETTLAKSGLLEFPDIHFGHTGIFEHNNKLYLVSAKPILTSEAKGPAVGSLVFLRELDQDLVHKFADTVHLEVSDYRYADSNLPAELQDVKGEITLDRPVQRHLSTEITTGYFLTRDTITHQPAVIWRISMPRSAYSLGKQTIIVFMVYFSVIGLIAGLILLALLRRTVIRRLTGYNQTLEQIRSTGDLDQRVKVEGDDEISVVGRSINEFLARLTNSLGALSEEKVKSSTILQSMGEGVIVLDDKLTVLSVNLAGAKLLDLKMDQVVGKPWMDILEVYDGDRSIALENRSVTKVLKTGQRVETKLEDNRYFKTLSGRKFPVVTTSTPYHSNDQTGVVVVFKDATKEKDVRKHIENQVNERTHELDEARARLISSINSLRIGFLMTDVNQNLLLINSAAQGLFQSSLSGDDDHEIPVVTVDSITTQIQGKLDLVKEINGVIKTGKTKSITDISINDVALEINLSPIQLHNKVIGVVILFVDVSERQRLDKAKDDFLSIASHELRTPLTAIMGNASLIEQYYADKISDKELRGMLDDMKTASVRLIDLINDFLNVSRLEQGRISYEQAAVNISEVAKEIIKELGPSVKSGVRLTDGGLADYMVRADKNRLKEVVTNLVGNAIKYTEKGSIKISCSSTNGRVRLLVEDTGVGISQASQKFLFQKFQQAGKNLLTRDATKSSGLGLYIAKLLITQMGGTVGLVKSEPEVGSTFYVELPIATAKKNKLNKTAGSV